MLNQAERDKLAHLRFQHDMMGKNSRNEFGITLSEALVKHPKKTQSRILISNIVFCKHFTRKILDLIIYSCYARGKLVLIFKKGYKNGK